MSIHPVEISSPALNSTQGQPTTGFSTGSFFSWLHDKNVEFKDNIRGKVNHEYNHLLREKGLASHLISGGEDFHTLGMDKTTPIVRPDLYFQACQTMISCFTKTPFSGLEISTATFFDLLHSENVRCSDNVRGLINNCYNELLSQAGITEGKIPGNDLHQFGMDERTSLRADFYLKAYGQVIVNFDLRAPYSHCGPIQIMDIFNCTVQFMGYGDIFCSAQVCKLWNYFSNQPQIWQQFFKEEKIPFVESRDGKERDYKQDFRILYPITISGRMIESLFGKMIGEIPPISAQYFERLSQMDLFGEEKKTMGETFVFQVVPHLIARTSGKEFPFVLDEEGNLIMQPAGSSLTVQELMIPFSTRNLERLCSYPLAGKENTPVFYYFLPEVLDQSKPCSDKVSVFFMRRNICCRDMSYPNQKNAVEALGFEVASLPIRALFDAVCILTSGTCPDAREPRWSYARTSDTVDYRGEVYQSAIGGFAPGSGARVCIISYVSASIGVVPAGSAEVPRPLAIETLAIDKGH